MRVIERVVIEGVDILDRIRKSKVINDKIVKIVEEIKKANVKVLRNEEWREKDRLMLKDRKCKKPRGLTGMKPLP